MTATTLPPSRVLESVNRGEMDERASQKFLDDIRGRDNVFVIHGDQRVGLQPGSAMSSAW